MSNQIAQSDHSSYWGYYSNNTLGAFPLKVFGTTINATPVLAKNIPLPNGLGYIMYINTIGCDGFGYCTSYFVQPFDIISGSTIFGIPTFNIANTTIVNSNSQGPLSINTYTGGGVSLFLNGSSTNITNWTISVQIYSSTPINL